MKTRISLVNYLNSVPLGWGFTYGPYKEDFEVVLSSPAACADQLRDREAEVGLIPVIEYQRLPDLKIIPNVAIASKRKVRSVLLISKVPIEEIKRVSLDTSSRTSVALLKILLSYFYRLRVQFSTQAPNLDPMLKENDAALIIGDPALRLSPTRYLVYDMVEEWNRFTSKPFVFAFWAVRSGVDLEDKVDLFERSKKLGLENLRTIARSYAPLLSLREADVITYLTECVSYDLDADNLAGLHLFFDLAHRIGLIEGAKPLSFYERTVDWRSHRLNSSGTPA